jgi:MYXO-CTERM domain-containing protein
MKKTLIALFALVGVASADSITLTLPANGVNNGGNDWLTSQSALTEYADKADGGYMFNNGGLVSPNVATGEGILITNDKGEVCLTMAPRTGAGGSGEVIILSGTELAGKTVESLTFNIAKSTCTTTANVALTLAVIEKANDTWSVKESTAGALTLNSGASLNLTLDTAIEWTDTYKVVAMIDNTAKTLGGGPDPLYTLTGISVEASTTVPEPATATLSLLALAGLAARRRRK